MRARLVSGEVVTLPKDCSCCDHEGPHWLHEDRIEREHNEAAIRRIEEEANAGPVDSMRKMQLVALVMHYAGAEERRLKEKLRYMKGMGIAALLPEGRGI